MEALLKSTLVMARRGPGEDVVRQKTFLHIMMATMKRLLQRTTLHPEAQAVGDCRRTRLEIEFKNHTFVKNKPEAAVRQLVLAR